MDYLQPKFYRFNEDSLKLVRKVSQEFREVTNLLDVGAGCGVIGIELAQKISVSCLDLLEVQLEFTPYLEKNLNHFVPYQDHQIFIGPLGLFKTDKYYDLIVSNPPYYLPDSGQASQDQRRGICRSFQIDSWKKLLELFEKNLAPLGSAWVVIKNDKVVRDLIQKELVTTNLKLCTYPDEDVSILKFYLEV